jgi:rhodanese-related sulfurtransferase
MKKELLLVLLLFLILIKNFVMANQLDSIKVQDAFKMQSEQKAVIVDVRELVELKEGMIKMALPIPISLMEEKKEEWQKKVSILSKDTPIIVYCRSGRRAEKVGAELLSKGYKVLNMGGFESWKDAGLPVEIPSK